MTSATKPAVCAMVTSVSAESSVPAMSQGFLRPRGDVVRSLRGCGAITEGASDRIGDQGGQSANRSDDSQIADFMDRIERGNLGWQQDQADGQHTDPAGHVCQA